VAIRTTDLLRAHDMPLDLKVYTGPNYTVIRRCPVCITGSAGVRTIDGLVAMVCAACASATDLYAALASDAAVLSIRSLIGAGIRVPKRAQTPAALQSYRRYRDTRKAAEALARTAESRHLESTRGAVGAHFGLTTGRAPAHDPSLWWEVAAEELSALGQPGWLREIGPGAVVTVIPAWVPHDHAPTGMWAAARVDRLGGVDWVYRPFYGRETGVGFLPAAGAEMSGWGNVTLVVLNPNTAMRIQTATIRDIGRDAPVVLMPPLGWAETGPPAVKLTGAAGTEKRFVVWLPGGQPAAGFATARRLNAAVTTAVSPLESTASVHDRVAKVIAGAEPWQAVLGAHLQQAGDWAKASILAAAGFDQAAVELVRPHWSTSLLAECLTVMRRGGVITGRTECRAGFTVEPTAAGWVRAETGELLLDSMPVVTGIEIRARGRVIHSGEVVCPSSDRRVPFRTTTFRRDASAVIERALLARGLPAPFIAPAVAPYIAAVALKLHKLGNP
jgi:hypothetical protein